MASHLLSLPVSRTRDVEERTVKVTWRSMGMALGVGWLVMCATGVVAAAPRRVARDAFVASVAGSPGLIETFDGFAEGVYAPAIPLANGIYAASAPSVYRVSPLDHALSDGSAFAGPRTFSAFPPGTRYWGADLGIDARSALSVTVVGAAETVTLEVTAGELDGFLGVVDPLGLRAVTIVNLGEWNLSFDNVTTATGDVTEARTSADADATTMATHTVVADDGTAILDEGDAPTVASAGSDDEDATRGDATLAESDTADLEGAEDETAGRRP